MKIVYCINSIRYLGGTQMAVITKANALADVPGNEVYIAVSDNQSGMMVHGLSDKVHFIDLQINYYSDDWKSWVFVLEGIFVKRRKHKKVLKRVLREIRPDVVISVGTSEKYFLPEIKGPWKTIREYHYTKDYRRRLATSVPEKLIAWISDFYDSFALRKYDQIVVLTHEDKERNWANYSHVSVIPNFARGAKEGQVSDSSAHTIITIGRLELQKNYDSLIRAYKSVATKHPDWKLEIWGEGSRHKKLQKLIYELNLDKQVKLCGYTAHVHDQMAQASVFVLTSIMEGFGLVLIEAMSCGLPVVSYECPCGPRDIIRDGEFGFLVPVNDEILLAERLNYLVEHHDERKAMSIAAQEEAQKYSVDKVIPMWMDLFHRLTGNQ